MEQLTKLELYLQNYIYKKPKKTFSLPILQRGQSLLTGPPLSTWFHAEVFIKNSTFVSMFRKTSGNFVKTNPSPYRFTGPLIMLCQHKKMLKLLQQIKNMKEIFWCLKIFKRAKNIVV